MDSEGTNGAYIVMGCDVYIVMNSEVKLFMITDGVFLCLGDVHIEVLYGMELNDLLHCGTEGGYVNGRMDTGLEIAGTWTVMVGSQVASETLVGGTASGDLSVNVFGEQHRCPPTGGRRRRLKVSRLIDLRSMVRNGHEYLDLVS